MYQEITESENEKKARLKMLYEIGEQLKVEQGLADMFKKVVEVMYNQLNSEEAALFVLDEKNEGLIQKVAVRGPSEEITAKLLNIEKPYCSGQSLIGKIYRDRKYEYLNEVPSDVEYQHEYSKTLPSKKVCHYIGVPLILGKEVLGVIRVINKRAATYSIENSNFRLSDKGFDEEDVELLQTIASQVASAIRSAKFIEVQRYYKELVENSPDPIIVLDEKGRVKVFNKACEKIWGYSEDEVKGESVTRYYETESHARFLGSLLERSKNHRITDQPAKIKARSGESIPISLSAALLFDNQDNKIGSIGVFKDFRETLRRQDENLSAEKLVTLGKLAHTIGHEIKHNIAAGLNYIDTLAYECSDDEELSEIYREIQETLRQAVDKFQNMLMIGKPKPPEKKLISYEDIIKRVRESLRRRAKARNIDFTLASPNEQYILDADIEQLRQVITNLFDNSLDAIGAKPIGGEKGRIELLAQASNGDLHLTWQDNGCGISVERMPQMFLPFTTTKSTGNGLGLFIIRNIIENHGGSISVASEEGRGTRFKIVLPLSQNTPFG
jgi:PAS domain S-box-containing protein